MFEAYVHNDALQKAWTHARTAAQQRKEAMGLLVGQAFSWKGKEYCVIEDYVTAKNDADAVSVRFNESAFGQLAAQLISRSDRLFVGWCHSHPGYGCFLSSTDVNTQQQYFPKNFHVAIVLDPLSGEKKAFKVRNGKQTEASFAVIEK